LELIAEPKNVAIHNDNGVTAARMIESFNAAAPALYDPLTRERGYIESEDRQGKPTRFPLTTLSIGAFWIRAQPRAILSERTCA
jgi:hypothetical protein